MKKYAFFVVCLMLFVSCDEQFNSSSDEPLKTSNSYSQKRNLNGTEWKYEYAPDCINKLNFLDDSLYSNYNCEMQILNYGVYEIKEDLVYLYELGIMSSGMKKEKYDNKETGFCFKYTNERLLYFKLLKYDENSSSYKTDHEFSEDDGYYEKIK